jgi:hypothetical protein
VFVSGFYVCILWSMGENRGQGKPWEPHFFTRILTGSENSEQGGFMGWGNKPVHRQQMVPWYDTRLACRVAFWLLLPFFVFSLVGIFEALQTEPWRQNIWVPLVMALISLWLMVRMGLRVTRRRSGTVTPEKGGIP